LRRLKKASDEVRKRQRSKTCKLDKLTGKWNVRTLFKTDCILKLTQPLVLLGWLLHPYNEGKAKKTYHGYENTPIVC